MVFSVVDGGNASWKARRRQPVRCSQARQPPPSAWRSPLLPFYRPCRSRSAPARLGRKRLQGRRRRRLVRDGSRSAHNAFPWPGDSISTRHCSQRWTVWEPLPSRRAL